MSDQYPGDPDKPENAPLSPLRPQRPDEFQHDLRPDEKPESSDSVTSPGDARQWTSEPQTPQERLERLRGKMRQVVNEYVNREISRAQFNAIYAHYNEQRTIIEKIIARDPTNQGWKSASRSGKTSFLREHFEARPVNYVIYLHNQLRPLMGGGTRPDMQRIIGLLKTLWRLEKMKMGVARVELTPPHWIIMAAGHYSVTFVTYHMEPSGRQANHIQDLHHDFERANKIMLQRGRINKAQMVFPQRSLLENKGG